MTPGPGHNMAAMALEKIRYSSFAMSPQHRAHLLGFTKMKVLTGMSDAKHGLYDKEIGSLLGSVKLPEAKKDPKKDVKKDAKDTGGDDGKNSTASKQDDAGTQAGGKPKGTKRLKPKSENNGGCSKQTIIE